MKQKLARRSGLAWLRLLGVFTLFIVALSGCGQKGDLYLPSPSEDQQTKEKKSADG